MSKTPTLPLRPAPQMQIKAEREAASLSLSPLVQLMPTGYRNVQPFQKGQGWHTNGRTPRRRPPVPEPTHQRGDEDLGNREDGRVVFPLLTGLETARSDSQGPHVRAVEAASPSLDTRQEVDEPARASPRAPVTPTPPSGPRRPPNAESTTSRGRSNSFRNRQVLVSPSSASKPTSPATISTENATKDTPLGPDPALMQQLWLEYAKRSHAAQSQVDPTSYHRRMHRRYGEQRALKERVAELEQALAAALEERDEARAEAEEAEGRLELAGSGSASSLQAARSPKSKPAAVNDEEESYRERSFALERALAQTKATAATLRSQLAEESVQTAENTRTLEAQLTLERQSARELARQLREASVGFTRASAALAETRVALEREQQQARETGELVLAQNAQLLSDARRHQLETRVKLAVRSLGREALRVKTEVLLGCALRAEHRARVAQLETQRVIQERDATREQLEQVLSSHALKYHSLGAAGGVPGILARGSPLWRGSRTLGGQLLLLQVLYEEPEAPETPEDAFTLHVVAYEPRSAQDDFLSFRLRDIRRLVPNSEGFLVRHADRRQERLQALGDLLLTHVHAGYKHGHLVLVESAGPEAALQLPHEQLHAELQQQRTQYVLVYRGTRYLRVSHTEAPTLADVSVVEGFTKATSQLWWLELRVVLLDGAECDVEQPDVLVARVDLRQLRLLCPPFASYRPSESVGDGEAELFAVHEVLLEPLFDRLCVIGVAPETLRLEVATLETESRPSTTCSEPQSLADSRLATPQTVGDDVSAKTVPRRPARTLNHRCIVNVDEIFYCVRLQEFWDGELLLDVIMDDPDSQQRFRRVLRECELVKLAARLVRDEALEKTALQVTYGLATALHAPLCKLVKSHLRPVLRPETECSREGSTEAGEVDLGSLLEEEASVNMEAKGTIKLEVELRMVALQPALRAAPGGRQHYEIFVLDEVRGALSDVNDVREALEQLVEKVECKTDVEVHGQRLVVRLQDAKGWALVRVVGARLSGYGDVKMLSVLPLRPADEDWGRSLLLASGVPLQRAFEALGLVATDDETISHLSAEMDRIGNDGEGAKAATSS